MVKTETMITLMIFIERIRNLSSNSSAKCLLSQTFSPRQKIPYGSEVIVETMTKVHFSEYIEVDYVSLVTGPQSVFFPQNMMLGVLFSRSTSNS